MTRILVADDHKIARLGICNIIKSMDTAIEIDEAGNFEDTINCLKKTSYNLVTLDIHLPGSDGFNLLEHILIRNPEQKVVIISMNPEKLYALRFLKTGAWGYIEKTADDEQIKTTLKHILNGHKQFSASTIEALLQETKAGKKNNLIDNLSNREIEVMQLLIKGTSLSAIANSLHLHIATIATYKTRIYEKVGVRNIIELSELFKQSNMS